MTSATFVRLRTKLRHCSKSVAYLALTMLACGGTLDAGWDEPRGNLPVDARNPIVICNDGAYDDWQGEYALLFASTGRQALAGIVINDGWPWTNLDENIAGWQQMVAAARNSGLRSIPDPLSSPSSTLVRPSDGNIDSTVPNESDGARFLIDASKQYSQPFRPLVIVTGGRLTDVADAYLMDHTLPERTVVVSSLGSTNDNGGVMGVPNGQLDTWADVVVAQRFRFVQVSSYHDAATDVPSTLLPQLPTNAFATWIQSKQEGVAYAYDQAAYQVVAMPEVVSTVAKVLQQGETEAGEPLLVRDPNGPDLLVSNLSHALATARFWQLLLDPATFQPQ